MGKYKVAAAIIAGDSWNTEEVKKMLASLDGHIDTIFVNYNGKKKTLPWQKWTKTPIIYKKNVWKDDFALARNQSFDMVPKDEYDWILWADVDDTLVVDTSLDELIDSLDEYTTGIFLRYDYAIEPKTKIVVVEQWRERLLSTKVDWKWFYRVHEVAKSSEVVQYAKRNEVYIEHQRTNGDDRGARQRNRRIITRALTEDPNENRYKFYFAAELMAEADSEQDPIKKLEVIDAAILAYNNYRETVDDITEDIYLATTRIAELQRMKKDYASALEADMEAIAIFPSWPDGYVGAAKTCLEIRDFSRMKAFADMASKCPKPDTSASIEPMLSGFTPIFLRGIANEELELYEQASKDYELALTYWTPPDVDLIQEKIKSFKDASLNKDKDIDERKKMRSTKADKSICFFTQYIPEPWHPKTLKKTGSGGAELCIMKLAPMFEADGWRVVVFGTPGENRGIHEGVEYWNTEEYVSQEKFKVFVSSRSVLPFQVKPNADASFLWNHDVNLGPDAAQYMNKPDKVIGLTNWHSNHLQKLYNIDKNRMTVIPNGVSLDRFPVEKWNNQKGKLIYSSSPDRGLEQLLSLWSHMKNRYPELELNIYYGWNMVDKIIEHYKNMGVNSQSEYLKNFKGKILHHIDHLGGEDAGIFQHGRVNQDVLAEAMLSSDLWCYPTTFCVVEDTPIDCPRDHEIYPEGVPIKDVKPGQLVWTLNEEERIFELKPVKKVWLSKKQAKIYKVLLDSGRSIRCTGDHPFMLKDGTWKNAEDLKENDSLTALQRDYEPFVKLDPDAKGTWVDEYSQMGSKGVHMHHIDERHINNDPSNLEPLEPSEHHRRKAGWTASDRQKRNMSKSQRGTKRPHAVHNLPNVYEGLTPEERKAKWREIHPNGGSKWSEFTPEQREKVLQGAERGRLTRWNHKVVSVVEDGYEDVWDIEVEDNHNFVVHGAVLHNCETFAITAIEMQAAGVIPVTSNLAALTETVSPYYEKLTGWPLNNDYQTRFLKLFAMSYEDEDYREEGRKEGRKLVESYSWENAYSKWNDNIKEVTK